MTGNADRFPLDVAELRSYFEPDRPDQKVRAIPGMGLNVPIWILGSSLYSAQLAGMMGLPYAFASHFAPDFPKQALALYRGCFEPSDQLKQPYAMVGLNVVAAESDQAARRQFTSLQQAFANIYRGTRGPVPPPIDDIESYWSAEEKAGAQRMLACSVVGSPQTTKRGIEKFIADVEPDELMITTHIYDHSARLRSFEISAKVRAQLS
jgi:luciferase family oxidoreductase group 1